MRSGDVCTIYLLTNTVNDKIYVGQTWLPLHIRMGKEGSNYRNSLYLYRALQKYGVDKFQYEILVQCRDQESADYLEEYFINQYDSRNSQIGYNLKEGGSAGRHSDETKEKIAETMKNKIQNLSSAEKIEWSKSISEYWDGKKRGPQSDDRKQHTSEYMKVWHSANIHPMLGKTQSEDTIIKISDSSKEAWRSGAHTLESIKQSAETRKMDSEREQGIVQNYQQGATIDNIEKKFGTSRGSIYRVLKRNNISRERDHKGWVGKKHSEETKQKMSAARKNYWNTNYIE